MDFNVENYLSNLSYINKDFPSLWNEILETVPKLTNKWLPSEANESDPLVVLLKELAIIADKLNYNIDKNILELFPATLTQLRSAYNVYESLGYTPDWYISAVTGITITYTGMVGGARLGDTSIDPIEIPKWTQISDDNGEIIYTTLDNIKNIIPGTPGKFSVNAIQGTLNDFEINGSKQITINNLDSQNRLYFNEYNIAQNGIIISNFPDFSDYNYEQMSGLSDNDYEYYNKWRRVTNLNQYSAGNRVYKLGIDNVNNSIYIQFPDDIGNLINNGLYIKYILSNGEEGNIGKNDLSQIINENGFTNNNESNPTTLQTSDFVVTNTKSAQNGKDPLDIDEMRREFNRTVGIFDTLVTLRDYENYLYEYEDNDGNNIVSNIKVSDRFNDLTDSIIYKTMASSGIVSDTSEVLKWGEGTDRDRMTAYDLKFYPLTAVNPIETKNDLDKTFEVFSINNLNPIEEVITDVKCINHDFARDASGQTVVGIPVLIPYDLNGQIYLQTAVSEEEASEISSKVQTALLRTLNARELEWGSPIDYGTVVDTIKNADNRIQYVALNAIEYKNPENLPTNTDYDEIKRNILIGNKSWAEYTNFINDYNETDARITSPGDTVDIGGVPQTLTGVSNISTQINIGTATAENPYTAYKVNTNETFTVLIPQYNTITTYGNYLYYVATGNKDITGNDIIATAGTPYRLKDGQKIYIFETRDAAEAFCNSKSAENQASYILNAGVIIEPSADIKFLSGNLTTSSYVNMGSSITINILERAEGTLRTSNNIAANIDNSSGLSIATNSQNLIDLLTDAPGAAENYTLLADEYLFYTDDLRVELGIISEGTTISIEGKIAGQFNLLDADNVESVLNGNTLDNANIWVRVNESNIKIKYSLNELFTFGSNYIIAFLNKTTIDAETSVEGNPTATNTRIKTIEVSKDILSSATTKFTNLPANDDNNTGVNLIRYAQLNAEGGVDPNSWIDLNQTLVGDPYSILIRMALITGPGVVQNISSLEANSDITSPTTVESNLNTPTTTQKVIFNFSTSQNNPYSLNLSGTAIQTNRLITYQGGNPLNLMGNEQNISIYGYTPSNLNITYGSDGFIDVATVDINSIPNKTLTIPGIDGTAAVIPYIVRSTPNIVEYVITKSNTSPITFVGGTEDNPITVSINSDENTTVVSDISKLGRPYVTAVDANYYTGKGSNGGPTYSQVLSILNGGNAAKLNADYIYRNRYCPIYQPASENIINDPTVASSYFLEQHPYNNYVLPKLDNINITISPLSITK